VSPNTSLQAPEFAPPASFEVLRLPVYRRALLAAVMTVSGLWMLETVLYWTVSVQTRSGAAVGLVVTFVIIPALVFVLPSGVAIDRFGPRPVMLIGLGGLIVTAAGGGLVTGTVPLDVPIALLIAFLLGAFDVVWEVPSNVLIGRVVEDRLMAGAISLATLQNGFGRVFGGVVSGLLLQVAGPAAAMALGGLVVLAAALLTLTLPSPRGLGGAGAKVVLTDFRDAVLWVVRQPTALVLIALGCCVGLFGFSYLALVPVIARLLNAGPNALGLLTGAGGAGIILAALVTELFGRRLGRGRMVAAVLIGAGLAVAGLGIASNLSAAVVLAALTSGFLMIWTSTNSLMLQKLALEKMRGRALAVFWFIFWGILPIGTSLAGVLSDRFGARLVLILMGTLMIASAALVAAVYRPLLRVDIAADGRVVMQG